MRDTKTPILIAITLLALLSSAAIAQDSHAFYWSPSTGFIDMGVLNGGTYAAASAINDSGVVAGFSLTSKNDVAFKWTMSGGFQILPDLGMGAEAFAINSKGEVAGFVRTPGATSHAAKWLADGTLVDLGTQGGNQGEGLAINDQGDVAGNSYTTSNSSDAFVWSQASGFQDIAGSGYAYGLNRFGVAVGEYMPRGEFRSFVWSASHGITQVGSLGGPSSVAYAINSLGQIVGASDTTNNESHAFLWMPATGTIDLGTLPSGKYSQANAINSKGQSAGFSTTSNDTVTHGVVWNAKGATRDLGTLPGGTNSYAYGINTQGAVVGSSQVQ